MSYPTKPKINLMISGDMKIAILKMIFLELLQIPDK
jgi:hypothetical protein